MEVFPSGKTPSLINCFIPAPANGITDLRSLYDSFCQWVSDTLNLDVSREAQEQAAKSTILGDPVVGSLIQLEKAKRLLFEGDVVRAIHILDMLRRQDLAAIYFWGAVAHQYWFVETHQGLVSISGLDDHTNTERLLNTAIGMLITLLKEQDDRPRGLSLSSGDVSQALRSIPVDSDAQRLLEQLQAKDQVFVEGLLQERPSIPALESKSLNLTSDDQKRLRAAVSALSSLELLHLAEAMRSTARSLPFTGSWTDDLRQEIKSLVELSQSLTFRESSVTAQLEQLLRRL
jgi:hypothetical protein